MLSEVVNALFLTFLATDYLIASNQELDAQPFNRSGSYPAARILFKPQNLFAAICVVVCNAVDRLSGLADWMQTALHKFLHAPKIIMVAFMYILVLYWDCRRLVHREDLSVTAFLRNVGVAFCYVLPVYPFLAVLISCGFFILLTIFDMLRINADILNWPIYYGTLYGPFSFVYWKVKRNISEERMSLPRSHGRKLGSA